MIDQEARAAVGEGDPTAPEGRAGDWASDSPAAARVAYKSLPLAGAGGNNFTVDWEGEQAYVTRADGGRHPAKGVPPSPSAVSRASPS